MDAGPTSRPIELRRTSKRYVKPERSRGEIERPAMDVDDATGAARIGLDAH